MTIRPMRPSDVEAVTELCAELGYRVGVGEVAERLAVLTRLDDHAILVSEAADGRPAGWIHAQERRLLTAPPSAEISGLVVARRARRSGIGRALVAAATSWAAARGLELLRVRSNVGRPEAHPFYEMLGFARTKTSHVYDRPL